MYTIELVWNREFNWVSSSAKPSDDLQFMIKYAKELRDSGDGARVKKIRVINNENGKIEWNG